MLPAGCVAWEYSEIPGAPEIVAKRCTDILLALRNGEFCHETLSRDTRPIHERMFRGCTPVGIPYYAGHYRGEPYPCLQVYNVMVRSDPRVGVPHDRVAHDMSNFADNNLRSGFAAAIVSFADARLSEAQKLHFVVRFACKALEEFLRIHPYANGNGHMGRMIVWLILAAFGYLAAALAAT